jgi:Sigma-70 region 2
MEPPKDFKYLTFESAIKEIDILLSKHRYKWQIKALAWLDWEDIAQIIRLHLFKKWDLYNKEKPLAPWVNMIINNQMINLSRNVYLSMERPCLQNGGCAFNEGNDSCSFTKSGQQCGECPLFRKWEKSKKNSHNINLPVPMENHINEVFEMPSQDINLDKAIINFHEKMREMLTNTEYKVYNFLYIEHLSEQAVAEKMNYISTEKGRVAGYNSFLRIKKKILEVANKIKNEIDFV